MRTPSDKPDKQERRLFQQQQSSSGGWEEKQNGTALSDFTFCSGQLDPAAEAGR